MERYHKAEECIYPYKYGCKGCIYNDVPELFDGGCILLYRNMDRLEKLEQAGKGKKANKLLDEYEREDRIAYTDFTGEAREIHRRKASKLYKRFLNELDREEAEILTATDQMRKKLHNAELPIELL